MPKKRKVKKGSYKCSRCGRTFPMPMHLGRHMSAIHGKKKAAKKKLRPGRTAKRADRPRGAAARLGLRSMSLEQLTDLITAARQVATAKIAELHRAL